MPTPRKTDSQDVKDALTGRDIGDLKTLISNLTTEMREGFNGVHHRQDTTNGKVLKSAQDIIDIKTDNVRRDSKFQYNRLIWYVLTVCVSIIIALGSFILFKH